MHVERATVAKLRVERDLPYRVLAEETRININTLYRFVAKQGRLNERNLEKIRKWISDQTRAQVA